MKQPMEKILYALVERGIWNIDRMGNITENGRSVLHRTQQGYLQARKMIARVRISTGAHRLIWMHFMGPIPEGLTINHKNGEKADNRLENLEVLTYTDNRKHAFRTGLVNQDGQKNPASKLMNSQIVEIRNIYAQGGTTLIELSKKYKVAFQTISKIVRGKSHKRLKGKTADYSYRRTIHPRLRNQKGQYIK